MDARALLQFVGRGDSAPIPRDALPVPLTPQDTDYSCGAAAVLACLRYYGVDGGMNEGELYDALGTTDENGTAPTIMADVLNQFGLGANYRNDISLDDLRAAVSERVPVILDIQAVVTDDDEWHGHYVVLIALDKARVYFMDPAAGAYLFQPLDEFERAWFDVEGPRGGVFVLGAQHAPPVGRLEQTTAERMR